MVYNSKIEEKAILLPITQTALRTAQQFAEQQPTPAKKEQVYFNTLAVYVVNNYMELMDIPTDLRASDSWNPAMRLYADVADLKLTQLGHLECRPIRGTTSYIPLEVPDDRIGVIVVKIDAELQEATLVGFAKTVKTGELFSNHLQSVDDLLEYIDRLEHNQNEINLSQWLQNIFEAGWQTVEEILAPKAPQLAFRSKSGVTRGKLVDLGIQPGQSVALVMTLTSQASTEIQLRLQVHATGEQVYLPDHLTVQVLDEEGVAVIEAQTKTASTHVSVEFNAQLGERFSIRLELGDTNITENFIV